MRPFQAPSERSRQIGEDLSTFLNNEDYRKEYNKILGLAKKFRNAESKRNFLENCISENLIPSDFNYAKKTQNNPKYKSVNESVKSTSFAYMKVVIEENAIY